MRHTPLFHCTHLLVLSLGLVPFGCGTMGVRGSGHAQTQSREVAAFTALDVSGAYTVEVTVGTPQSVALTVDDNLLPLIRTAVADGRLVVDSKESLRPEHDMTLRVQVADLRRVELSGATKLSVRGVANDALALELSGAADVTAAGATKRLEISASGAAEVDARALTAEVVRVDISGAGDAKVTATKALEANISGAGSVRYAGSPADVKKNVSGAGSIEPM